MIKLLEKFFCCYDPVKSFEQDCFRCHNCKAKNYFAREDGLVISTCSKCDCPLLIPAKIGEYILFQPLGAGGMGSVYKAISIKNKKLYAVKIIPRQRLGDKICQQNIMSEGQIGEILGSHANIIASIDYGIEDGEYYMATEFCKGERLDNLIDTDGPMSEKRGLKIALQLNQALIHVVDKGFLYRDMKPENIMIDNNGTVKLFDFGLCMLIHMAAEPDDEEEVFSGSPLFIPPERIVGEPEGEFSEVYTLGLVLFYILTGKTYYTHEELLEVVKKHVTALRISSTRFKLKHCGDKTISVLDKMIQRNPGKRYQTLKGLETDLITAVKALD